MEEAVTPLSAPPMQSLACPGDNQSTFIPQRIQPTAEESDVDQEEATMDIKNINWQHHGPKTMIFTLIITKTC
jgi:hypothetical protein